MGPAEAGPDAGPVFGAVKWLVEKFSGPGGGLLIASILALAIALREYRRARRPDVRTDDDTIETPKIGAPFVIGATTARRNADSGPVTFGEHNALCERLEGLEERVIGRDGISERAANLEKQCERIERTAERTEAAVGELPNMIRAASSSVAAALVSGIADVQKALEVRIDRRVGEAASRIAAANRVNGARIAEAIRETDEPTRQAIRDALR